MNDHSTFMPILSGMAKIFNALGGGMLSLVVIEFGFWAIVSGLIFLILRGRLRVILSVAIGYLATGLVTLALPFYALTPAMNIIGVTYLTLIWPFWVYLGAGVPSWLAPYIFTF